MAIKFHMVDDDVEETDIVERLRRHIIHDLFGRRTDGAISVKEIDQAIDEIEHLRRMVARQT